MGGRKFDIDVLPEVVHLKTLLVIGHDGAHHVFIPVLFFPQQFPDVLRAFAVQHISEDAASFVGESVVDENKVDFSILDTDASHWAGGLPLIDQENKGCFLFRFDPGDLFIDQDLQRLCFSVAQLHSEQRHGRAGNAAHHARDRQGDHGRAVHRRGRDPGTEGPEGRPGFERLADRAGERGRRRYGEDPLAQRDRRAGEARRVGRAAGGEARHGDGRAGR